MIMERMNSPYENLLDMYIVEKSEGFCKIGISYRKDLTNPHGNYHGGAIASIIDTAAVQGLRTILPKGPYLTVDVNIRYKKPSNSMELFAEARPKHLKGKFFSTEIKVIDKENNLVALAIVKSFLPEWEQ
jgi:acyl-CoA thioesterase